MIVVLGATGHTGSVIVERLLKAGTKVRAVARNKEKLQALAKRGAEAHAGSASDADFLARALDGAKAAYTLLPPNFATTDFRAFQDQVGEATASALRRAGVPYVVFLSSIGADADRAGPVTGLGVQERRLADLPDAHVLSLRPGYFFENHLNNLALIKQQGINGGSLLGDLPLVQVASPDIGAYAARVLQRLDFQGKGFRELHGPRPLSLNETTRIIGKHIGKPDLRYVQFPYEAAVEGMVQAGLPRDLAVLYNELSRAFNEGSARPVDGPTPETTLPTDFEQFVEVLAQAYAAA